jgi:hypothetical protein
MQGRKSLQMDQEDSMTHLAIAFFGAEEAFGAFGLWAFLSVGAVALFAVFLPITTWLESRRKEREAFYKSETIRRVAEASGDGARATIELLREEERRKIIKARESFKIGGVINLGVGIGLVIFLRALLSGGGTRPVYLCGLIPTFIGVAMLVYVYFLASAD